MTAQPAGLADLERALREIESFVAEGGWDQPTRLFALVDTHDLLERQPELADSVGQEPQPPPLTSVEQDEVPPHDDLTDLLAQLHWPSPVLGVAVVAERIVLPTDHDLNLPTDPAAARAAAVTDPRRHELRVAAAATRAGEQFCLMRLRQHDDPQAIVASPTLMPQLTDLIAASLSS